MTTVTRATNVNGVWTSLCHLSTTAPAGCHCYQFTVWCSAGLQLSTVSLGQHSRNFL